MTPYARFIVALKAAVEQKGSLKAFADECGMNYATIYRWINGKQIPSLQAIEPVLPYLGTPAIIKRLGAYSKAEFVIGTDLPTMPVFSEAGAGLPVDADFWKTEPDRRIQVLPEYYRQDAALVKVVGDSMEPTIKNGAYVSVVPYNGQLREGGIYLVNWQPFGMLIKRIRSNKQGEIVLISDNPQYEPQAVPYEGYENIIIGEVIWYLQRS